MSKYVVVEEYNTAWPEWFAAVRARVWPAVAEVAEAIEHVGSTSVPGLAAKPVIDIDIVVGSARDLPPVIERLAGLGYAHRGNLGIEGREAFRRPATSEIPHHLYVCVDGNLALRNHLLLRDHLRANPADRDAYAALKRQLAEAHTHDMDRYIAGKTGFITAVLRHQGMSEHELREIEASNAS